MAKQFLPDKNRQRKDGSAGKGKKSSQQGRFRFGKLNWIHFVVISLLILLLPVVREWRTIAFGERVEGTVVAQRKFESGGGVFFGDFHTSSEIIYTLNGKSYTVYGPENMEYQVGSTLPLILDSKKEGKVIIATLSGFYLQMRSVSMIMVLLVWIAIYSTIVQIQKGTLYMKR